MFGRDPGESARLEALHALDILDTEREEVFDRVTSLAAHIYGAPVALLTLVDRDRQWFKSKVGLDVEESGRDISFCSHALGLPGPLVVTDPASDPRFRSNPLVISDPGVRFYAGAQLRTADGLDLGALCVIDMQKRKTPDEAELGPLADLAAVAMSLIEHRRAAQALAQEVEARAAAEQRAEVAREQAQGLARSLSEIVARASHDLRSPLGVILGFGELMDRDGMNAEQLADLEEIRSNAQRMLAIMEQVLDEAGLKESV